MNAKWMVAAGSCAALLMTGGCKKTADNKLNFKMALDTYYAAKPACLWPNAISFPVQVDTSDKAKAQSYDALVDQGLLVRTTAEKKVFIVATKQVTNYDISDKGRAAWTADPQQPGYGNFCYGKPSVTVDSNTPTTDKPGATTVVSYHYSITGAPGWATAPETQVAYPGVAAQIAGTSATATLTNTTSGWAVTGAPGRTSEKLPVTPADGKVVE